MDAGVFGEDLDCNALGDFTGDTGDGDFEGHFENVWAVVGTESENAKVVRAVLWCGDYIERLQ